MHISRRLKSVNFWIPALIGAGAAIAGGVMSANSASSANSSSQKAAAYENAQNREMQERFAKEGIRWKVADAKAAGIHPLAALGAQTHSYTPSTVMGQHTPTDYSWMADAGQQIAGAVSNKMTSQEKQMGAIALKNSQLDTQIKGAELRHLQIANAKATNDLLMGTPMPSRNGMNSYGIEGQGTSTQPKENANITIKGKDENGREYILLDSDKSGVDNPWLELKYGAKALWQDMSEKPTGKKRISDSDMRNYSKSLGY